MKVAYLTAGAGGMYCGSCLRDNALAAALLRHGRDVTLIPLYTPIRTDEQNVSIDQVYYGGISVYLEQRFPIFRHLPRFLDKFLSTPALLRAAMKGVGATDPALLGRLTISILRGEHGAQNRELDILSEALAAMRPDVIHLPNALFVGLAARLHDRTGAAIVCTLTGEDLFIDKLNPRDRAEVFRLISDGGRNIDAFISVTRYYGAACCEQFGLSAGKMHDVPLGITIDNSSLADSTPRGPFTIGYLARICPEKGLLAAVEAVGVLRKQSRDVQLTAAGYLGESDRPYLEQVKRCAVELGLGERFSYLGELDHAQKSTFLRSLHAFSVPTVYREAKGLYVLEAMSHGIPVVQPRHGSFPELIETAGGGLLAEPGDSNDLASQLAKLIDDRALHSKLAEAGYHGVRANFTDEIMAEKAWQVFELARGLKN